MIWLSARSFYTIEKHWVWLCWESRAFKNGTPGKASFTLAPECYVMLSTVSWDGYPAYTALKSTTPGICFVFSRGFTFFLAKKSNSETRTPVKQSLIKQNGLKSVWKLSGNILAINILKYFLNFQNYWFQPYNCIQCKTRNKMSKYENWDFMHARMALYQLSYMSSSQFYVLKTQQGRILPECIV